MAKVWAGVGKLKRPLRAPHENRILIPNSFFEKLWKSNFGFEIFGLRIWDSKPFEIHFDVFPWKGQGTWYVGVYGWPNPVSSAFQSFHCKVSRVRIQRSGKQSNPKKLTGEQTSGNPTRFGITSVQTKGKSGRANLSGKYARILDLWFASCQGTNSLTYSFYELSADDTVM